ncbi:uncharacterized protein [Haliotis asinina]|uniref:uncharacterized protein n=1 Tax=Haliotis asinina TaxID=109174 RepID=UPI00353232B1
MATLPDLRKSSGRVNPQGPTKDCQPSTHPPRPLDQSKQFHAYFCQDTLASLWTRSLIDDLEGNHGFKCAEYHRDLVVGERVLDLMTMFIFTSDRIVFILSEKFLKSNYAMYQLHLAVQYDIDHDTNNIVALHLDECKVPSELLTFQVIDTKSQGWKEGFLDYLKKPAPMMPAQICTNGTHVSVTDLCKTNRSVMSEPPTLKATLCIPDYIRHRIRIWHRCQSLDETHLRRAAMPESRSPASRGSETSDDIDQQEIEDALTEDIVTVQYSTKQLARPQATMLHCLNIRLKGQIVYEARETRLPPNGKELGVEVGDVLEILQDEPTHGNMYKCKNAFGHVGFVPKSLLSPSLYLLPSQIVEQFKQTISALENEEFRKELVQLGISYFIATRDIGSNKGDAMKLSVKKGDVVLQVSTQNAGRAVFKNCRNEMGYLPISLIEYVNAESPYLELDLVNTCTGRQDHDSVV